MDARFDPQLILQSTSKLRHLARTLVRDEHLAEDLVQETWLAWLRRPPNEPRALTAWLSRVLRNLASSARRRDNARLKRELARARSGTEATSPGESLERFEALKAVVDIVAELDEPGRSTILLLFFDELTLAQIAGREGISPGAVRLRLKSALKKLRSRLDRRFGSRLSWVVVLAPLLAPGDFAAAQAAYAFAPAPGAMVTKALGGILSMSMKKLLVSIAASILVFLGVVGSRFALRVPERSDHAPAPRDGSAIPSGELSRAAVEGARAGEEGPVATVEAVPAGPGAVSIDGRVMGDDVGLGGARVVVLSLARWETVTAGANDDRYSEDTVARLAEAYKREASSSPEESTGPEGRFAFRGLVEGSYRLLVSHPDRLPNVETVVSVASGAPAQCRVDLAAAMSLQGDVRDGEGRPVADAVIEAEPARTAYLRGMARDLRLLLDWGDGSMLLGRPRASSDSTGAFRLGPLSPAPHALKASHAAFVSSELVAAPGGHRVTLILRRGAAFLGRVLGPDGRPAGARVTVGRMAVAEVHRLFDWSGVDREPAQEPPREARSGPDGRFRIDGLDAGTHELKIEAPGLATLSREVEVEEAENDLGDLQLEAPLEIAGRVLTPDRHGLEGARVRAGRAHHALHEGNRIAPESPPAIAETRSDAEGRFALRGLPPGEFQVEAEADGFARALAPSVPAGEDSLELVLEEGITVHGKVIDDETLGPVTGAEIELLLGSRRKASSDAQGLFVIRGFPREEGRYGADLRVTHTEYGVYSAHAVTIVRRTARSPLEVRLRKGSQEIRGRVQDKTGQPIANAQVWIEPEGQSSSYSTPGDRTISRADGSFRLPEPAWIRYNAERLEVVFGAFHAAHAAGRAGPFLAPATGERWPEIVIESGEGASLEGIVTGSQGSALAGARVTAGTPSGGGRERRLGGILGARSTFTGKDGRYRLDRITAGETEVVTTALEHAPARVSIVLKPGLTRQDISLDAGTPIRGRVVAADGSPLEGVDVTAAPEGDAPGEAGGAFRGRMELRGRVGVAIARTGMDGRYEMPNLAPGSYTVIARARGYEAAAMKGILAGESARDIVLERFSALRGIVVGSDGAPLTAFKVDAIDRARRAEQEARADWRVGSQGEVSFQDPQGRFVYDGLRPGEYDIVVTAPGFLAFRGEARLEAGEEATIEARLSRGCRLEGLIRDAVSGLPVMDAMVTCTRQLPRAELEALMKQKGAARVPMSPPSGYGSTWTDAGGAWTIDGLLDGEYLVMATHAFYLQGSARLELGPGGAERVELFLEPTGRLEGTVGGLGGPEPPGPGIELHHTVNVELVGASDEDSKRARANGEWSFPVDRSGRFQAQGLRAGIYKISLQSRPYRRGKFEETGPGWGNSRLEPAGPGQVAELGEVAVRTGETATFNAKASR